jgi:hypothetical protein
MFDGAADSRVRQRGLTFPVVPFPGHDGRAKRQAASRMCMGGKCMKRNWIQKLIDPLQPKPKPPLKTDLENQILSKARVERVRQLDQQAQDAEERMAS